MIIGYPPITKRQYERFFSHCPMCGKKNDRGVEAIQAHLIMDHDARLLFETLKHDDRMQFGMLCCECYRNFKGEPSRRVVYKREQVNPYIQLWVSDCDWQDLSYSIEVVINHAHFHSGMICRAPRVDGLYKVKVRLLLRRWFDNGLDADLFSHPGTLHMISELANSGCKKALEKIERDYFKTIDDEFARISDDEKYLLDRLDQGIIRRILKERGITLKGRLARLLVSLDYLTIEPQEVLEILKSTTNLDDLTSYIESGYCKELTGTQLATFLIERKTIKLLEVMVLAGLLGKLSQENCNRLFEFFGLMSCLQAFSLRIMSFHVPFRPPYSVYSSKDYMNLDPEGCPFCRRKDCICGILEEKPYSEHEARLDVKHGLGTCSHDL